MLKYSSEKEQELRRKLEGVTAVDADNGDRVVQSPVDLVVDIVMIIGNSWLRSYLFKPQFNTTADGVVQTPTVEFNR